MEEDSISLETAINLCDAYWEEEKNDRIECEVCRASSLKEPKERKFHRSPDNRGCEIVNKWYDSLAPFRR